MSSLEGRFKERMAPALRGLPVILDRDGQALVAWWATKTWLLLETAVAGWRGGSPAARMPPAFYTHLREFEEPPRLVQVWIGETDADKGVVNWLATKLVTNNGEVVGIVAIMTIGRLLFQLYASVVFADGPRPDEIYSMSLGPTLASGLRPIWPPSEEAVTWPPPLYFAITDLQDYWLKGTHEEAPSSS